MKITNNYSSNTDYRVLKFVREGYSISYLQFMLSVEVVSFPDFWNTKMVNRWLFIPDNEQYTRAYITKEECLRETSKPTFDDLKPMFSGTDEDMDNFIVMYPNIDMYIDLQNFKRALYTDRKSKMRR